MIYLCAVSVKDDRNRNRRIGCSIFRCLHIPTSSHQFPSDLLRTSTKPPDMRSLSLPLPVALSLLGSACAFQIPFLSTPDNHPGKHNTIFSTPTPATPVTSDELEQLINPDNLFRRAEQLFEIAKLSIEEYGHPTRVIGSKGARYSFLTRSFRTTSVLLGGD